MLVTTLIGGAVFLVLGFAPIPAAILGLCVALQLVGRGRQHHPQPPAHDRPPDGAIDARLGVLQDVTGVVAAGVLLAALALGGGRSTDAAARPRRLRRRWHWSRLGSCRVLLGRPARRARPVPDHLGRQRPGAGRRRCRRLRRAARPGRLRRRPGHHREPVSRPRRAAGCCRSATSSRSSSSSPSARSSTPATCSSGLPLAGPLPGPHRRRQGRRRVRPRPRRRLPARPLQLAVGLGQMGEFGFVLGSALVTAGAITGSDYVALLAAVVVSIAGSAILVRAVVPGGRPDAARWRVRDERPLPGGRVDSARPTARDGAAIDTDARRIAMTLGPAFGAPPPSDFNEPHDIHHGPAPMDPVEHDHDHDHDLDDDPTTTRRPLRARRPSRRRRAAQGPQPLVRLASTLRLTLSSPPERWPSG